MSKIATSNGLDFLALQLAGYFAMADGVRLIEPAHFVAAVCRIPGSDVEAVLKSMDFVQLRETQVQEVRAEVALVEALFAAAELIPAECGLAMAPNQAVWDAAWDYTGQRHSLRESVPSINYDVADKFVRPEDPYLRSFHVMAALLEDQQTARRFGTERAAKFTKALAKFNLREQELDLVLAELDRLLGLEEIKGHLRKQMATLRFRAEMKRRDPGLEQSYLTANYLFFGNPGTGKTTVAMLMGRAYRALGILPEAKVVRCTRSNLVSEYHGGTAPATLAKIEEATGGVLLIDDAYSLVHSETDAHGREALEELNSQIYERRGKLVVILAGYELPLRKTLSYNAGLASRFECSITFPDYSPVELAAIFETMARRRGLLLTPEFTQRLLLHISEFYDARRADFGNARDMEKLLRGVEEQHAVRVNHYQGPISEQLLRDLTAEDLKSPYDREIDSVLSSPRPFSIFHSCGKEMHWQSTKPHHAAVCPGCGKASAEQRFGIPTPGSFYRDCLKRAAAVSGQEKERSARAELEQMIGLEGIKDAMERMGSEAQMDRWRLGEGMSPLRSKRHMVFTGNPGTGKTTVARLVGEIFRADGVLRKGHCVECTAKDLIGRYKGWTAEKAFDKVEEALDGVLFIDEAYDLVPDRQEENDFGAAVIVTLLKAMEDYGDRLVVIVAGYPERIDRFLKWNEGIPSRFPETNRFAFPDYQLEELMRILELMARKYECKLEPGLREKAQQYLAAQLEEKNKYFGNGRLVRNLFEAIVRGQALRLKREFGDQAPAREMLERLNEEDFPPQEQLWKMSSTPFKDLPPSGQVAVATEMAEVRSM